VTAIAAIASQSSGRVYMAGDSAITSGWNISSRYGGKVFRTGPYVMGVSGGLRGAQIVQYHLDVPEPAHPDGLGAFMATVFVDRLRKAYKDAGYAKKESDRETSEDNILVGVRGRIFTIWGQYAAEETTLPYATIGSGGEYALGSLHTTHDLPMRPRVRLELALLAAEQFNAAVRGPFTFASTPRDDD
jgi:ATP-dependent protease HslVU (ClpYQ) peptidase subunit